MGPQLAIGSGAACLVVALAGAHGGPGRRRTAALCTVAPARAVAAGARRHALASGRVGFAVDRRLQCLHRVCAIVWLDRTRNHRDLFDAGLGGAAGLGACGRAAGCAPLVVGGARGPWPGIARNAAAVGRGIAWRHSLRAGREPELGWRHCLSQALSADRGAIARHRMAACDRGGGHAGGLGGVSRLGRRIPDRRPCLARALVLDRTRLSRAVCDGARLSGVV